LAHALWLTRFTGTASRNPAQQQIVVMIAEDNAAMSNVSWLCKSFLPPTKQVPKE